MLYIQLRQPTCLLLGGFLVEREAGIDLSRDPTRNDREDLLAKFDKLRAIRYICTQDEMKPLTSLSVALLTWVSRSPPFSLAYLMATSMRRPYPGLLAAAKINEGLVVASYSTQISTPVLIDMVSTVPILTWGL